MYFWFHIKHTILVVVVVIYLLPLFGYFIFTTFNNNKKIQNTNNNIEYHIMMHLMFTNIHFHCAFKVYLLWKKRLSIFWFWFIGFLNHFGLSSTPLNYVIFPLTLQNIFNFSTRNLHMTTISLWKCVIL